MVISALRARVVNLILCAAIVVVAITSLCGFTNVEEVIDIPEEWVIAGAKLMYGEACGVENELEIRATLVVALNRMNDIRWSDDLVKVIYEPNQFAPWKGSVSQEWLDRARDTIETWYAVDDFYILPKDYFFFSGDGKRNHFRKEYTSREYWDWSYEYRY